MASEAAFAAALETFQAPGRGRARRGRRAAYRTRRSPPAEEKFRKAAAGLRRCGTAVAFPRARAVAPATTRPCAAIELGDLAERPTRPSPRLAARGTRRPSRRPWPAWPWPTLEQRGGQLDKAIDAYRQMADDSTLPLPRDYALMRLAATLEEARRGQEAGASYRRVVEEFPQSVYAAEARRRMEYLQAGA